VITPTPSLQGIFRYRKLGVAFSFPAVSTFTSSANAGIVISNDPPPPQNPIFRGSGHVDVATTINTHISSTCHLGSALSPFSKFSSNTGLYVPVVGAIVYGNDTSGTSRRNSSGHG